MDGEGYREKFNSKCCSFFIDQLRYFQKDCATSYNNSNSNNKQTPNLERNNFHSSKSKNELNEGYFNTYEKKGVSNVFRRVED